MKPDLQSRLSAHKALNTGILEDVGRVINGWIECPHAFHQKSAFGELNKSDPRRLQHAPLNQIYNLIKGNWDKGPAHSKHLWRWKPNPKCADTRKGDEVKLERAIINLQIGNLKPEECTWANQVPTSSGLANSRQDRHRNIDLIRRHSRSEYDFIELKVADKHPLYAAMEILCYGLLYVFCREKKAELKIENDNNKDLLRANTVHLCVLAPATFYDDCRVEWLSEFETLLSDGIRQFADQKEHGLKMDFRFDQFSTNFPWPSDKLQSALNGIKRVCSG